MKIYLAGPLGFSEAGRAFYGTEIVRKIAELGHVPLDPWSLDGKGFDRAIDPALATEILRIGEKISQVNGMKYGPERRRAWEELNPRIGAKNAKLIDACDMVFAVLDGTDVDSGTAAEIGYAFARGRPTLGYRGDFRLAADNDGSTVNLQVEYFITASGGTIIAHVAELKDALASLHLPPAG